MSAYILSKPHIDAMVEIIDSMVGYAHWHSLRPSWAREWLGIPLTPEEAVDKDALGQKLWDENHASVNYRYKRSEHIPHAETPAYAFAPYRKLSALSIANKVRLFDCYEYQTCEHEGWENSKLHWLCVRVRDALLRSLITKHEWDNAGWSIDA